MSAVNGSVRPSESRAAEVLGNYTVETLASGSGQADDITVISTLAAYTLGANIENGWILASGAANMTGNALGNELKGNYGADTLYGLDGNDILRSGPDTDTVDVLYGGAGDDIYHIDWDSSDGYPYYLNAPDDDIVVVSPDAGRVRVAERR